MANNLIQVPRDIYFSYLEMIYFIVQRDIFIFFLFLGEEVGSFTQLLEREEAKVWGRKESTVI